MNWNDFILGFFCGYVSTLLSGLAVIWLWPRRKPVHTIYRKGQLPERVR